MTYVNIFQKKIYATLAYYQILMYYTSGKVYAAAIYALNKGQ